MNGEWKIVGKLPQPLGYGVSIQDGDNIWLIGGETDNGAAVASIRQLSWDGNRLRQQ
ncbi:kelch repeat-containing protein [Yersinia entomophaga]|uniref:kelch repeat-containing protein n=1 Tax=Yersinia entomophaga TaxID=935293 RepID=UPI00211AD451|nr:kelch repeat-containing protein [Yersinia entomophaga]